MWNNFIRGAGVARLNREVGRSRRGPAAVRGASLHAMSLERMLWEDVSSHEPKPEELPA